MTSFRDQHRTYHPRSGRRDYFVGATVVVHSDTDVDRRILVVYVCARRTAAVDVSIVRFFACLFDSPFLPDGASISGGRAGGS